MFSAQSPRGLTTSTQLEGKLQVTIDQDNRIDQRPPTAVGALSLESLKEVDTPLPSHTLWKRDLWDTPGVVS